MEDVLVKMDPDKKEALIQSALKEFGNHTFDKASTNVIVKEAGISKGLLFHYFPSKQKLYDYLVDFFFEKSMTDMVKFMDFDEPDLLERISKVIKFKMAYIKEYPSMIGFAKVFYQNHTVEDAKAIINEYIPDMYLEFYTKNVDYSLFKEGIDVTKVIQIVQWTVERLSDDYGALLVKEQLMPIEVMYEQVEAYILEFKKGFYKNQ